MKIVFFVPKLINCGPLNVVLSIVKVLCLNPDISVKIVTYRDNHLSSDFRQLFENLGVREVYSLERYNNPIEKFLYLKSILKDSDVIHSHGFFPDLYSSFLPLGLVKVATVHSVFFKDYPATYGTVKGLIYALMHHLVYLNPSFDKIVSCSDSVQGYLNKFLLLNKNKSVTVHNGVDQRIFNRASDRDKLILKGEILNLELEEYNLNSKVYIFSGRLTRLKRVPELIEWFNKLPHIFNAPNILIVLGDGEEMELCREAAKGNKNILFMGFVNDVINFYKISDYLLSFSAFEGFPMSVIEGISCGCKAILSDIPSHREIVNICPTMAILITDFSVKYSNFTWSEDRAYHLSSIRMTETYKLIYKRGS